uniref:NAD(P)/FAD-dependent oxidoreductase n=1 Tax=Cronobacter sakazakii TaxID=28141 RepID=UPI001319BD48
GGDSAITEAIYLTKFADSVTIIHRRDQFRAAKSLVEKAQNNPKIKFILDSVVTEAKGDEILEGGGDSAITEAIYLTKFADSVTIIHRRDQFRAAKS